MQAKNPPLAVWPHPECILGPPQSTHQDCKNQRCLHRFPGAAVPEHRKPPAGGYAARTQPCSRAFHDSQANAGRQQGSGVLKCLMFSGKCEIVAPRARLELATLRFAPAKLFTSCNDPFLSLRLFALDSSRKWRDVALWRYMGAHKERHISKSFLPPLTRSLIANVGEVLTRRAEPLRWHDSPSIGQTGRKVRRGVTVTLGANSWLPTEECLRMCRISRDLQIHSTTAQTLPVRHQPHSKNSRDSLWNQRVKPGTRPDMVHANGSASR